MTNNNKFFQWLGTDKQGQIMIFDHVEEDDGDVFVCFKDGSRINENFVLPLNQKNPDGKLMAEIESPNNTWKFDEKWVGREEERWETNADGEKVCVQPFLPGKKKITLIPPKPTTSKFGDLKQQDQLSIQDNVTIIEKEIVKPNVSKVVTNDPVTIMLDKSKKVDTEISMDLTVSLPSKDLFNIIKTNFDDGDKKTLEYIINNLNIDDIKNSLKDALQTMYNEFEINHNIQ